ncbi:MAG: UbiH/UbiF/VisC/COQ6 family ubiquinone biosynthesis hydroxylase [Rhodocyclaceae bacterium]
MQTAVAVVGAGPVGLAAACALGRAGIDCVLLDARSPEATGSDPRAIALSQGSRQILAWMGAWRGLDANPIRAIHVSQLGHFGRSLLCAADLGLPALGYVCGAGAIAAALRDALPDRVTRMYEAKVEDSRCEDGAIVLALSGGRTLRARLAAFAEGAIAGQAGVLSHDYGQRALLATASVDRPHEGLAWERFTRDGMIALLPMGSGYAVVWVAGSEEAARLDALDAAALRDALQERFGSRLRFGEVRAGPSFPLALRIRREAAGARRVWLGNSAQTLHPVAGQGYNLALRDVWQMAELVRREPRDPGAASLLRRHARARAPDRLAAAAFTDGLVRVFSAQGAAAAAARGAALLALDLLGPLRGFLARRMIFGARAWP